MQIQLHKVFTFFPLLFEGCKVEYKGLSKYSWGGKEVESKSKENSIMHAKASTRREGKCFQLRIAI